MVASHQSATKRFHINNIYQNNWVTVRVPEIPLAPGALEIVTTDDSDKTFSSIYKVYQQLRTYWTSNNLAYGCLYIERRDSTQGTVTRQIVPYTHGGVRSLVRKAQVTWNLMCPRFSWTDRRILGDQKALEQVLAQKPEAANATEQPQARDPFCNTARIQAQEIQAGTDVRMLYNFKPLSAHDLLITTKAHMQFFDKKSFVEAMRMGLAAHEQYKKHATPIMYLHMADHPYAGQTVPHAHMHASFAQNVREEVFGIAKVIRKIFIDSWLDLLPISPFKLSDRQLVAKIAQEKALLGIN